MEKEIKRENYLQKLIDAKGDGLIKVVTELRKVGKSYLLGTIFRRYLLACNIPQENIIEMNLSFDEFAQYKGRKGFTSLSRCPHPRERALLFDPR